jgi:hypothetical protein
MGPCRSMHPALSGHLPASTLMSWLPSTTSAPCIPDTHSLELSPSLVGSQPNTCTLSLFFS